MEANKGNVNNFYISEYNQSWRKILVEKNFVIFLHEA